MALLSICCKVPHKNCTLQTEKSVRQQERILLCNCSAYAQGSRFFLSTPSGASNRWRILHPTAQGRVKMKTGIVRLKASKEAMINHTSSHLRNAAEISGLQRFWKTNAESLRIMCHASNSSSNGKHLDRLDSYFGELEGDTDDPSSDSCNKMSAQVRNLEISAKEEIENLDAYLGKLNRALEAKPFSVSNDSRKDGEGELKSVKILRNEAVDRDSGSFDDFQQDNEASDIYLVGLLASVNIGVFLFEIASPIKNSELQLFSLPLLYGAKINDLILVGEWWRLLTPMFLHAGGFHLIVGCWSLLTFGPQVCRGYGSFTFFMIYVIGGISGNLTSFLHTPEATVGGTGPIFAVIGAWLIYQSQNKDVIDKNASDSLFQKAVITTGLCFILSHFGPIDDWTHLGAVLTGIVYGYFTCPTLQLDDASSSAGQDEGVALVGRNANPCKSLVIFVIFLLFLSSLLFLIEPPLDSITSDDLI